MRAALVIGLLAVAGCATEKLGVAPPAGVDFSGEWKLNAADSDDPQRVVVSQNAGAHGGATGPGGEGGRGTGRTGANGGPGAQGPLGPVTPAMSALADGLRWPGRQMQVEQAAGVVTITSLGTRQVYRPGAGKRSQGSQAAGERKTRALDRGDGAAAACGWEDRTLVVESDNLDDERPPFEERYSLSGDGQRLIEVVAFKGGRSGGFTVSRVWDRVAPAQVPAVAPGQ